MIGKLALVAGAAAIALAGCSSSSGSSGGGSGPGTDRPVAGGGTGGGGAADSGTARGVSITASAAASGAISVTDPSSFTARYETIENDQLRVTFDGGDLDARTLVIDTEGGTVVSGLQPGEDVYLSVLARNHSTAAVLDISNQADQTAVVAAHAGALSTDSPSSGTVTYTGALTGLGFSTVAGTASGDVSISANFDNRTIAGNVSSILIRNDDAPDSTATLGDIAFTGTMATDRATYSGTNVTIGGNAATGLVDGGFYGPGAAETAGSIVAVGQDGGLIGAYIAD
jgi:hypothetical protein